MIRPLLAVVLACSILFAVEPEAEKMKAFIQGEWAMMSAQDDGYDFLNRGKVNPAAPRVLRVKGDAWELNYKDRRLEKYTTTIHGDASPLLIDCAPANTGSGTAAVLGAMAFQDDILAVCLQLSHRDRGRTTKLDDTNDGAKDHAVDKLWFFMREDGFITVGLPSESNPNFTRQPDAWTGTEVLTSTATGAAITGPAIGKGGAIMRFYLEADSGQGLTCIAGGTEIALSTLPSGAFQRVQASVGGKTIVARTHTCSINGNGKPGPVYHSVDLRITPDRLRVWAVGTTIADLPLAAPLSAPIQLKATAPGVALRMVRWKTLP
ncbi:hypothetical protein LBMAG53_16720 [Planctomycetota bacterium]|nr:hypothetical protein LBMAG53_16720 [Planctomycetota bacterium]